MEQKNNLLTQLCEGYWFFCTVCCRMVCNKLFSSVQTKVVLKMKDPITLCK